MVSDDVHPVDIPKVRLEPLPNRDLNLRPKTQVVVARQTCNELPPSLAYSSLVARRNPGPEEDVSEPGVFPQPIVLAVLLVPFLQVFLLPLRVLAPCWVFEF